MFSLVIKSSVTLFPLLFYPKIPENKMTGLRNKWVDTTGGTSSSVLSLGHSTDNSLRSLQNEHLILIIPGGWWVGDAPPHKLKFMSL